MRRARSRRLGRRCTASFAAVALLALALPAPALALPDLPDLLQAILVFGTWVNPLAFVPLAFNPQADETVAYRAIVTVSFACVSGGLVAVAVEAIKA